jgi:hypothetical protein
MLPCSSPWLADAGVFCPLALDARADAGGSLARPHSFAELREAQFVVELVEDHRAATGELYHHCCARSLGQVAIVPVRISIRPPSTIVRSAGGSFVSAPMSRHEQHIADAVDAIERQLEWLTTDDGSRRGVAETAARYPPGRSQPSGRAGAVAMLSRTA